MIQAAFDQDIIHNLILNHMEDYVKFMDEVLALEMYLCMDRLEAINKTLKHYPQFNIN